MKIGIAQINATVGDIAGNSAKISHAYEDAKKQGADIVVTPELSLIGYPPEDLVLMPAFRSKAMHAAQQLAAKTNGGPALVVGCPWEENGLVYNAALLMENGAITHTQYKTCLPNYGIFDEKRIFAAGEGPQVFTWRGIRMALPVCEDIWNPDYAMQLAAQEPELLIVINASPFEAGKLQERYNVAKAASRAVNAAVVYVNLVGGQDDIVFDGGSFFMSVQGEVTAQLPEFSECCHPVAWQSHEHRISGDSAQSLRASQNDRLWQAMKLGLADYVRKNGFSGVVLGISGGIDSALTAAVAVDALGAKNVCGVLLPSPYTSHESTGDAHELAQLLGIETMTVSIAPGMEIFDEVLSPVFKSADWMEDVSVGGNMQARLRGMTLMAISNKFGWMLLSTSNKSEIAVGYSTLYGDSCGGYNVLKDLYKTQIYALAEWRNARGIVIPKRSITKAPTAELAPGQLDSDQLPHYETLDAILQHHLEGRLSAEEIVAKGFDKKTVDKILKMVRAAEYKRRQSCPGPKLSPMLFGKDRRYPLTNKY